MSTDQSKPSRLKLFAAELIGTALLLLVGLSLVILMFGEGTPFDSLIPNISLRRAVNGFLFATVGSLISISWIGHVSGAHVNPIVTMSFWLVGKLSGRTAVCYVLAQLLGALLGCLPLILWGAMGRSISFGATTPGPGYTTFAVIIGEVLATFALISVLCIFLAFRDLRGFTPVAVPLLFAIMVPLEASISGTSVNPARSFGPSVVSGAWTGWWIYWIGPLLGGLLALSVWIRLARRIEVAKLYHFDSDPEGIVRRLRKEKQRNTRKETESAEISR